MRRGNPVVAGPVGRGDDRGDVLCQLVGAKEPAGRDRSEAARAKMGEALSKPIPQASVSRIQRPASNGVVVQSTRRSA